MFEEELLDSDATKTLVSSSVIPGGSRAQQGDKPCTQIATSGARSIKASYCFSVFGYIDLKRSQTSSPRLCLCNLVTFRFVRGLAYRSATFPSTNLCLARAPVTARCRGLGLGSGGLSERSGHATVAEVGHDLEMGGGGPHSYLTKEM